MYIYLHLQDQRIEKCLYYGGLCTPYYGYVKVCMKSTIFGTHRTGYNRERSVLWRWQLYMTCMKWVIFKTHKTVHIRDVSILWRQGLYKYYLHWDTQDCLKLRGVYYRGVSKKMFKLHTDSRVHYAKMLLEHQSEVNLCHLPYEVLNKYSYYLTGYY